MLPSNRCSRARWCFWTFERRKRRDTPLDPPQLKDRHQLPRAPQPDQINPRPENQGGRQVQDQTLVIHEKVDDPLRHQIGQPQHNRQRHGDVKQGDELKHLLVALQVQRRQVMDGLEQGGRRVQQVKGRLGRLIPSQPGDKVIAEIGPGPRRAEPAGRRRQQAEVALQLPPQLPGRVTGVALPPDTGQASPFFRARDCSRAARLDVSHRDPPMA